MMSLSFVSEVNEGDFFTSSQFLLFWQRERIRSVFFFKFDKFEGIIGTMPWIVERLVDVAPYHQILSTGFVFGPSCSIGRGSMESPCDIHFENVQGLSRNHAELKLSARSDELHLTDIGAKYGTFRVHNQTPSNEEMINVEDSFCDKLTVNEPSNIAENTIIRFGAFNDKKDNWFLLLRFRRTHLSVCLTILDQSQKTAMKKASNVIGATIVDNMEKADMLVAPHITTTVKILAAIASQKPIVTPSWFSFTGIKMGKNVDAVKGGGSFRLMFDHVLYRPELDSNPNSQIASIIKEDPAKTIEFGSRSALMKNCIALVFYPEDEQYSCILEHCGAIVFRLYEKDEEERSVSLDSINDAYLRTHAPTCTERLLFFDEMGTEKRPRPRLPSLISLNFKWLTGAMLARAVCIKDLEDTNFESYKLEGTSEVPLPEPSIEKETPSLKRCRGEIEPTESATRSTRSRKKTTAEKTTSAEVVVAGPPSLPATVFEAEIEIATEEPEFEPKADSVLESIDSIDPFSPVTKKTRDEIDADVEPLVSPSGKWEINEPVAAKKNIEAQTTKMLSMSARSIKARSNNDMDVSDAEVEDLVEEEEDDIEVQEVGADGWFVAPTGRDAEKLLKEKRKKQDRILASLQVEQKESVANAWNDLDVNPDENAHEQGYETIDDLQQLQPVCEFVDIPLRISPTNTNNSNISKTNRAGDQRAFRKNTIRVTDKRNIVMAQDMDHSAFARESERAAMQQHEEMEQQAAEMFNEAIFADRFAVKAPARRR
jgi:hypothetical protein